MSDMTEAEYEDIVASVVLPDWVHTFEGVEPEEFRRLSFEDGKFTVRSMGPRPLMRDGGYKGSSIPVGDVVAVYSGVVEAYEAIVSDGYSQVLHESLDGHGGKFMGGMFICDDSIDDGRLLLDDGDSSSYYVLAYDYHLWITETAPAYHADPSNWALAYNYINFHPAFWRRHDSSKASAFDWETGMGADWVTVSVDTGDGEITVRMETGGHVPDDYRNRYADYRLMTEAGDLHEGWVKLARLVAENFGDDGVDYEKPQPDLPFLRDLRDRIDELERGDN